MRNSSTFGWSLVIAASIFILLASILIFYVGIDEKSTRTVLRFTSLTSAIPFLLVFMSKPFSYIQKTQEFSKWTQYNRRYLWLIFTASHLIHIYAIFVFFQLQVKEISGYIWWAGGIAYVIILIFATIELVSPNLFDEATLTKFRFLKLIYTSGIWYVWLIFLLTYVGTASSLSAVAKGRITFYTIPMIIIFLAIALLHLIAKLRAWKPDEIIKLGTYKE